MGPNVRKLYLQRAAYEAIPPGGGIQDGITFFLEEDKRAAIMLSARRWTEEALAAVRAAPDLPPTITDEEIAALILARLEVKQAEVIERWRAAQQGHS